MFRNDLDNKDKQKNLSPLLSFSFTIFFNLGGIGNNSMRIKMKEKKCKIKFY